MGQYKNHKNLITPAIVSVFSAFLILMALFFIDKALLPPESEAAAVLSNDTVSTGHIDVLVVDGLSDTPLENALVVIPEANIRVTTGTDGQTGPIQLPILQDTHYQDFAPQPWGEVTLLVYHSDYIPYAIFHAQVWENQHRDGPKVYLFKQDDTPSDQPFSIVEGPQRLWVNELLNKYAPN